MFSFRSSVRPIVRPPILSSVRQFECKFLSLMRVCMSVIFLISNSQLLTSNFDPLFSGVYACVREYTADVCTHMNSPFVSVFTRLTILLYFPYMFKYFCPPVGLMSCLRVRPSIYLTAYMHAYVEVSASVRFFCPPFCMHPWKFYFSVCTWVSKGEGIIVCLSVLFDLLSTYPIKQTNMQTIHPSVFRPFVRPSIHPSP